RQRPGLSLADQVARVGGQVAEAVHPAGGPADLELVDPPRRAEAEMEAWVAGGGGAAAAESPARAAAAAGGRQHPGAECVAVRRGALQAEHRKMAGRLGPVVEVGHR